MGTVTKTWAFAADAEGLVGSGSASIAFAWQSGDSASGAGGCVKFTSATSSLASAQKTALRAATGETWETWGVPAGQVVVSVQCTAWYKKLVANAKLSSHFITADIVNSAGTPVSSESIFATTLGTTIDAAWALQPPALSTYVSTGNWASTTDVRLRLVYTLSTLGGGGVAAIDQRFDEITVEITYRDPPEPGSITTRVSPVSQQATSSTTQTGGGSGTPIRLLDRHGRPMSVHDGMALPASASGVLRAGVDENSVARISRVESKFGAKVKMPYGTFADRNSPMNAAWETSRPTSFAGAGYDGGMNGLTGEIYFGLNPYVWPAADLSIGPDDCSNGTGVQEIELVYWATDGRRYTTTIIPDPRIAQFIEFNPPAFFIQSFYATKVGSNGSTAGGAGTVGLNLTPGGGGDNSGKLFGASNRMNEYMIALASEAYLTSVTVLNANSGNSFSFASISVLAWDYVAELAAYPAVSVQTVNNSIVVGLIATNNVTTFNLNPPIYIPAPPPNCVNLVYSGYVDAVNQTPFPDSVLSFTVVQP